jgi:hypothetical protein
MWNMKPVVLAHEILVRNGMEEAAKQWRTALAERISDEADRYLERLKRLQRSTACGWPRWRIGWDSVFCSH